MAGHNKWSKVKNIKGAVDSKRSKLFTKLVKEIIVSARMGGGNLDGNARLRNAVYAARAASMPKDNIERAIKKGTGELEGAMIEEVTYEGYGPGGVAILVETTSDNKNRTVNDLRTIFKSAGGSLAEAGAVAWMFNHFGHISFDKQKYPEDTVMEVALEAGAQDVTSSDDTVDVYTSPADVYKVRESFEKVGMQPLNQGFAYLPKSSVLVENKGTGKKLVELLETIEDHDDVQRVHSNMDMPDSLLVELAK